jgi:hypothetical protein
MHARLTAAVCAAMTLLLSISFQSSVHADPTYVRDLGDAPADIRWRHSGRQGGAESPEYFGREMASGDFNGDGVDDLVLGSPFYGEVAQNSKNPGAVYVVWGTRR